MNKTLLILSLFFIAFYSCKKTVVPPAPKPKAFTLATDTLYQYQYFSPVVKDTTRTDQTKKETYKWNWGDNTIDTGLNVRHEYLKGGNYTITLITNEGSVTKNVFVYSGTGIVQIVNSFTEPLNGLTITSNSGTGVYNVGNLLPGAKSGNIFLNLLPEYGPCTISGFVGDPTKKTVFFEWKENYLPTDAHDVFTITSQSTVYFYNSYGYLQDTWLSQWTNFIF